MSKNIKYSINTNCLYKTHSPAQIAQLCRDVGLDGIEWGLFDKENPAKEAAEMAAVSRDHGLEVGGFINAGHLWKSDIMQRYSEAVIAGGGKYLRVSPPWAGWDYNECLHQKASFNEMFKLCRGGLEQLEKMGARYGIRYVLETHMGGLCASPCIVKMLMDGLNPAYVGIIWDPGNGVMEGFLRPRLAIELMGSYLSSIHVKNLFMSYQGISMEGDLPFAAWQYHVCDLASGQVNWLEAAFAMKCTGYTGWLTFEEFFKASPEPVLKQSMAYMTKAFAAAPDAPQEPFTTLND